MTQVEMQKKIAELMSSIEHCEKAIEQSQVLEILNFLELLVSEFNKLQKENQQLRDEVNKLKGEKGKPNVRKQSKGEKNISSEAERKQGQTKMELYGIACETTMVFQSVGLTIYDGFRAIKKSE